MKFVCSKRNGVLKTHRQSRMPEANKKFQEVQYQFTAHIRDPENNPAPSEIEDRRMEIYRGLLYRNVQGFIANAFPVTRKLYSEQDWHKMIRDFFSNHNSQSPYFKEISKEFLDYLTHERVAQPEDPIFLSELAHYEWLEIMLTFVDIDIDWASINEDGDLLHEVPVLSPLIQLNQYSFPVHKIKPDYQPESPSDQPTFLLVYRDKNDKVGFMELNPMTARLVELIASNELSTSEELLKNLAKELPSMREEVIIHGGHSTLVQLKEKNIILGTKVK